MGIEEVLSVIVVDTRDRTIVSANTLALKMLGYESPNELVGKSLDLLIPEKSQEGHKYYETGYMVHPSPRPMGRDLNITIVGADGVAFGVWIGLAPSKGSKLVTCAILPVEGARLPDVIEKHGQ